jgi:hypothetical protein
VRKPLATIALLALASVLLAACGGSSPSGDGTGPTGSTSTQRGGPPGASAQSCEVKAGGVIGLQATAVSCADAEALLAAWQGQGDCAAAPAGASRSACTVRGYRCISAVTSSGLAVSCARPGHAIAFVAKRG